jgi:hypothetical protein
MDLFFGCALAVTAILLLIVWLGPRVADHLLCWYVARTNRKLQVFQQDLGESQKQIRAALEPLRQQTGQHEQHE